MATSFNDPIEVTQSQLKEVRRRARLWHLPYSKLHDAYIKGQCLRAVRNVR